MASQIVTIFWTTLFLLFGRNQGLQMDVSLKEDMQVIGSNMTISCSDKRPFDMSWMFNEQRISDCSLGDDIEVCSPGGSKYVVSPESNTFHMNLINLSQKDCGTYTCKTNTEQQNYSLRVIENGGIAELSETDDGLNVTTRCLVPDLTVSIQWYYIYKDGKPRLYDQPTSFKERTDDCIGACVEANLVRVTSTLNIPTTMKHPLTVKIMASISLQDGRKLNYTSVRDYIIEGCPPIVVDTFMTILLYITLVLCVIQVLSIIYHVIKIPKCRNQRRGFFYQLVFVLMTVLYTVANISQRDLPLICDSRYSGLHVLASVVCFLLVVAALVWEVLRVWKITTKAKRKKKHQSQAPRHQEETSLTS